MIDRYANDAAEAYADAVERRGGHEDVTISDLGFEMDSVDDQWTAFWAEVEDERPTVEL